MAEPIYNFVRGKGWVPVTNAVKMLCGTIVEFEIRTPVHGESYLRCTKGPLTAETWIQDLESMPFAHLSHANGPDAQYRNQAAEGWSFVVVRAV